MRHNNGINLPNTFISVMSLTPNQVDSEYSWRSLESQVWSPKPPKVQYEKLILMATKTMKTLIPQPPKIPWLIFSVLNSIHVIPNTDQETLNIEYEEACPTTSTFPDQGSVFNIQCSIINNQFNSNVHYSIPNAQYAMLNIQYSLVNVQCSMFNIQYPMFNIQCSVFNIQCSMF